MEVFFAQEISNFNKRPILLSNDANGEVSYTRSHLETETQCNTFNHVLCMTSDSARGSQFLSISPQFVSSEPLLFLFKETFVFYPKM